MPGTATPGNYPYPLGTESWNPPAGMQALANQIDLVVGGSAQYWVSAHTNSSQHASNRILSHDGTASALVDSTWLTNPGSYLVVDSSTDTGLTWSTNPAATSQFISSGTIAAGTLSFTNIPQIYNNLYLTIETTDTRGPASNGITLVSEGRSLTSTNNELMALQEGAPGTAVGDYWFNGGSGTAGFMEIVIQSTSLSYVPRVFVEGQSVGIRYKPFMFRSVKANGQTKVGTGKFAFSGGTADTAFNTYAVTSLRYYTAGTAVVRLYGIK